MGSDFAFRFRRTASLGILIVGALTVATLGAADAPTQISACVKIDSRGERIQLVDLPDVIRQERAPRV